MSRGIQSSDWFCPRDSKFGIRSGLDTKTLIRHMRYTSFHFIKFEFCSYGLLDSPYKHYCESVTVCWISPALFLKVHLAVMSSSRPIVSLAKQQALRCELENCHLVAGIYCTGLSTRQLKELRGSLPETSSLIVAKNSLMEKAVEGTKWEPLKFCAKGMNAWLFVHDDNNVPRVLKPYRDLQKKWGAGFNDFRGAVFEGKVYGAEDFGELETMPTRVEVFSYLLGCMQAPAATVVGILQEKDMLEAAETQPVTAEGSTSA